VFRVCQNCGAFDIDDSHGCPQSPNPDNTTPSPAAEAREWWLYAGTAYSEGPGEDDDPKYWDRVVEHSAYARVTAERDEWRTHAHNSQKLADQWASERDDLRAELAEARAEIERLKRQYDELKISHDSYQSGESNLAMDKYSLIKERIELRTEVAKWKERENICRTVRTDELNRACEERNELRTLALELVSAAEQNNFALQCMIIKWNGAVPGLTEQQVWDGAIAARDGTKAALDRAKKVMS